MKYFDAHAHVQFPMYDADRREVLERMREEEVGALIVGVDEASSKGALALLDEYAADIPDLYAAAGFHPNHAADGAFDERAFRALLKDPRVKAVGECGLDNYRPADADAVKPKQREVFEKHIQLALDADKPLMIHSRPFKGTQDAYRDLIDILTSYKREHGEKLRGDIHFFVGGVDEARDLIDLGFTLSFTAVLTFARDYDEVVRFAPLASILSETDAPYVAPASRRGQRNDPLSVKDVVAAIAGIRAEDEESVRRAILANATRLFRL
ncbi:MAG TPA: TatD family hydrolase [Candidatus Paceibacterota bacterium]|nr:TatD family hydrolase [Candidatus Paceibacterota bacterium]